MNTRIANRPFKLSSIGALDGRGALVPKGSVVRVIQRMPSNSSLVIVDTPNAPGGYGMAKLDWLDPDPADRGAL